MILKIVVGFFVLAFFETINGIFRIHYLHKRVGKKYAKILSFLLGLIWVFLVSIGLVLWVEPKTTLEAFYIGVLLAILMISYDLFVGRVLFKLSWSKIFEDFDPRKGNLLGFGMMLMVVIPLFLYWTFDF